MIGFDERSFRWTVWLIGVLTLVLLTAPTVVLLISSFTSSLSLKFPPPGYSFRWYTELLSSRDLQDMAWRSIKVATIATSSRSCSGRWPPSRWRAARATGRGRSTHSSCRR